MPPADPPDPSTTKRGRRGRLPLKTEPDGSRSHTTHAPIEPPTISAGGLSRTLPFAASRLSLEERFVDEGEIGRGGMGAVHRVYERSIGRAVAMKSLPGNRAQNPRARDRFLAEAQITGQLEHPNIIPVYELGQDDEGTYFFTMRIVEGRTLSEFLDDGEDDVTEAALEVFFRACDALSFAHSRGVLHRDVKPSNIMVGEHGQVYMLDWGIAVVSERVASALSEEVSGKTTTLTTPAIDERGLVVGTYAYMSPEQTRGAHDEMDARTDVFGLGAVLFRIVVGTPPFLAETASETLGRATRCELPDVDEDDLDALSRELLRVARQALQVSPDDRFQSVEALKSAVQGVQRGRRRFPELRIAPGTVILEEGAMGDEAYVIRRGECEVYREHDGVRRVLRTLGPGDVFGETAVFTGKPRNANIVALSSCDLVVVPGNTLNQTLGLDSWMGAFVRSLGNRFSERSNRVTELEQDLRHARVCASVLAVLGDGRELAALAEEVAIDLVDLREICARCAHLVVRGDRVTRS